MREVAALAKVSVKTVSRVLNAEPGAGADVVRRVQDAAAALGYRPNLSASNLRRIDRRSATWGVLFEDLSNPFDAALLRAVEDRAGECGVLVLAASNEDSEVRQRELLESLARRRVDGMVMMPLGGHQDVLQQESRRGMPMVLVDRPPTFAGADSVTTTNRESACEAATRLAGLGHRRIAFLGDRSSLWTSQQRYEGYVQGLARSGVTFDDRLVHLDLEGAAAAQAAAAQVLELTNPPSAVFAAQNMVTVGAMRALLDRGLQHRVALIGFDDFPLADMVRPAVSVVRQDVPRIGRTAADLLLQRIDGDRSATQHVVVPATFVPRGSGEIRPLTGAVR